MKIHRREFLTRSALGVGGALLGAGCVTGSSTRAQYFDPYEKVSLGRTKLKCSRVVLGTGTTEETIASGEYPYSRPLFIYVNKAKAEESSTVTDFVDFYLSDAGFDAVAEAGYIQVPDDVWSTTQQTWTDMTTGTTAGGD
jgi:hypothetical protein